MTPATRRSATASIAACAAVLACACVLGCASWAPLAAATGASGETQTYEPESMQAYESQLAAGEIEAVRFNPKLRSVRVTLEDGKRVLVHYQPHQEHKLAKALRAKKIEPLTIHGKRVGENAHPPGHKLRYIVGGAIVVVLILVIAGLVFVLRRRRALSDF